MTQKIDAYGEKLGPGIPKYVPGLLKDIKILVLQMLNSLKLVMVNLFIRNRNYL